MTLAPCARCARHVRITAEACPFCGASVEGTRVQGTTSRARPPRMGRAAMVALGAGALLAACGGASSAEGGDQRTEDHVTAGSETGNSGGHGEDPNASHDPEGSDGVHEDGSTQPHPEEGAPVAAYGAPAPDTLE